MSEFFIGRQPILNSAGETIAYELLFRSSLHNTYDPSVSGDSATSQVLINAVAELTLDKVVGNKLAFLNLTNRFLEQPELLSFLPHDRVVLEILETIDLNDAVISGIKALKRANYTIALDDYCDDGHLQPLYPLVDLVKFDITHYSMDQLCNIAQQRIGTKPKFLAERVETLKEFNTLREAGFDYFQGYFFAKPDILSGRKIPPNKGVLLHLLAQLNNDTASVKEISEIISREVSLGVRALRYVNSPMTGLLHEVTSIKQASVLLGRETLRHWVTMLLLVDMNDKPMELINMALIRGRFCQLTARLENLPDENACFTAGLLSLVDVMMNLEMEQVLDNISATQELRDILHFKPGRESELLRMAQAIERADHKTALDLEITDAMNDAYFEATIWADQTTQMLKS